MRGAILPLCLLQTVLLAVGISQPAVLTDFAAARQSATTLRDATGRSLDAERDIFAVLPMDADEAERAHRDIPRSLSNTPVCRTSAGNLDLSWAI
jgi:hypothetical protein